MRFRATIIATCALRGIAALQSSVPRRLDACQKSSKCGWWNKEPKQGPDEPSYRDGGPSSDTALCKPVPISVSDTVRVGRWSAIYFRLARHLASTGILWVDPLNGLSVASKSYLASRAITVRGVMPREVLRRIRRMKIMSSARYSAFGVLVLARPRSEDAVLPMSTLRT